MSLRYKMPNIAMDTDSVARPSSSRRPKNGAHTSPLSSSRQSQRFATSRASIRKSEGKKVHCFSEKLVPLKTHYDQLSEVIRLFTTECFIDATTPSLMTQYKRFEKLYETFFIQANQFFSSYRPNSFSSTSSSIQSSAIMKTGQDLINEWIEFIKKLNEVTKTGLTPHFLLISNRLNSLKSALNAFAEMFVTTTIKTEVTPHKIYTLNQEIVNLRKASFSFYRKSDAKRNTQFDSVAFSKQANKLLKNLNKLMKATYGGKCMMSSGDLMRSKMTLTLECREFSRLIDSTLKFEVSSSNVREYIVNLNQALQNVFNVMKLPFDLKIEYEEEEEVPDEETLEERREEKSRADSSIRVDAIRAKISVIEETLNETTQPKSSAVDQ